MKERKPTRIEMDKMVVGAMVRRVGHKRTAVIESVYRDIQDAVYLSPALEGFNSWHRAELRIVSGQERRK